MTTEDIVEIHQLLAWYGHAADAPSFEELSKVFTEDAVFHTTSGAPIEGLDAITKWFEEGKPPHPPSHHTTNVHVSSSDDVVRVKSKYLTINPATGIPRSGDYDDLVVRTPSGWRIQERVAKDRFGGYKFGT